MSRLRGLLFFVSSLTLAAGAGACGEQPSPPTPSGPSGGMGAPVGPAGARADGDAGSASSLAKAQASIFSDMEWPPTEGSKRASSENKSVRVGYLRHGSKAPVVATAHKKSNCVEGWYELVAGGFVCGKYTTLDLNHPRFKNAHPPDLAAALPYTYGVNATHGTPLYRQVPSREERLQYEPWLAKPRAKAKPAAEPSDNPYAASDVDAGASSAAGAAGEKDTPQASDSATPKDDNRPWYMKDLDGGAPVQITLDELKGEGPIARRMVKGFYLSLDRRFTSNGASWWKTNDGLVAPADSVWVAKPRSEFKGVWLAGSDNALAQVEVPTTTADGGVLVRKAWHLPIGFITVPSAHKYSMATSKKRVARGGGLHKQTIVQLTGDVVTLEGIEYFETDEGWWMRGSDGTRTEPGPLPEKNGPSEKWVDVNLKRQTLVAFEGEKPVFATIVSSGRAGHETPPGSFRIREKHVASTMDGDAEAASDGPYSIQDVPYIQYFSGGYALHGAFWHDEFGHTKSHGCVNLAPSDARAVFNWTEPQLPEGWHGVSSTKDKPGTRVVLHF
jgi:hypothetical protein